MAQCLQRNAIYMNMFAGQVLQGRESQIFAEVKDIEMDDIITGIIQPLVHHYSDDQSSVYEELCDTNAL